MLNHIFQIAAILYDNVSDFFDIVARQQIDEQEKENCKNTKSITRIYEDDITGIISHERFLNYPQNTKQNSGN